MAPAKDHEETDDSYGVVDVCKPTLGYKLAMALLLPFIYMLFFFSVFLVMRITYKASQAIDTAVIFNKPISSSVELVGVRGLDPSLAPGAAASPAFDLLLRLDNGDACGDQYREGGSVKVSYAGVPLAHGSTPGFRLGARSSATVAVNATSDGVGVPEELFRLMSAEQRLGVAQLDIGLQLGWPGWESYYWSVDLDG
ncbi:hypothetical protein [Oryza sativa Japonica Group]|uniref:Late embryogenesis abundant protein LEA-2 subgroup domain-containing protein n=2 Tax=Oryza sativa subsp. japonica TaxID=39947 RepID=A0A0P0V7A6_ORYSJ|nr:hypothetical protein [Oryza sativa Japonica Group]BAB89111.1 hypothetical protein [Oryza sativa Japonica Group]BAS73989.1 Os01g0712000 [Oryza sativa Japonica Group]